jgi:hypothetical protein
VSAFLDEAEAFPRGSHDDQVDAAAGAFSALTVGLVWDPDRQLVYNSPEVREGQRPENWREALEDLNIDLEGDWDRPWWDRPASGW